MKTTLNLKHSVGLKTMNWLKGIKVTPKTGDEILTNEGISINYSLLDFWKWSVSDILSNATRGRFAEFIVCTAIGLNPDKIRNEWEAYDLTTSEGIKIEIKSAAYIQSWAQKSFSDIRFSIKKSRYWEAETNILNRESKRHADVYVFCHLKHKDINTINPLKMEQWDFYILPTSILDNYKDNQISISIKSLQKLANPRKYSELSTEILKAYEKQNKLNHSK